MDRGIFLRSLPFLRHLSSPSAAWPPQPCRSSNNNSRCEIFLVNQLVSIEPTSGLHSGDTVGPAFFASMTNSEATKESSVFDPAMCKIEAALVTTASNNGTGMSGAPSPAISSASTTMSVSQSPNLSKSSPNKKEYNFDLFLRFENNIAFQVDCSQLTAIKVNNSKASNNDNGDSTEKSSLPPCLLLKFNSCWFRIFALSDTKSDEADNLALLKTALERITLAMTSRGGKGASAPSASAAIETQQQNSGSTTGGESSSHEAGQRDNQEMMDESPISSNYPTKNNDDCQKSREGDTAANTKRKRKSSFDNTWKKLKSLQSALELPVSSFPEMTTKGPQHYFGPLMNSIAEDLAQSYENATERATAIEKHEQSIIQYQTKMDVILNDVLPAPRAKQRRGLNVNSPAKCPGNEEIEDMLKHAKTLMTQQKQAMLSRHMLALAP